MEISPIRIFYMAVASLAFGMLVGVFNDVNRILRMLLGQDYNNKRIEFIHNIHLPISKRKIGFLTQCKWKGRIFKITVFFQDILLFSASAVGIALLNYYFNNGRARIFTPLAVIAGFLFYYFTVGKAILLISDVLVTFIRLLFLTFFEVLNYPITYFVKFFGFFAKKIYTNVDKTIAKEQKKVYNNNKQKNVMDNAEHGFVDVAKE